MILRKGMWVVYNDQIGILNDFAGDDAEFHAVGDDGLTSDVTHVALSGLRQAKLSEIPKPRRPKSDAGRALGYE